MQDNFETLDDFFQEESRRDPTFQATFEDLYPEDQLGAELAMMRENQDLTQRQLASEAGISQSMLNRIERGNQTPKISTLWKILRALKARLVFDPIIDELRIQPSAEVHVQIQAGAQGLEPTGFLPLILQAPHPYPVFSPGGLGNPPGFTPGDPFTVSNLLDLWSMRAQENPPSRQQDKTNKIQNFSITTQQGVA